MAGEGHGDNGLTPDARERLERLVVELLGIAAEFEESVTIRHKLIQLELMRLADRISALLDE